MDLDRLRRLGDPQRRLFLRTLWAERQAIEDLPVVPMPEDAPKNAPILPQQEALLLLERLRPGHRYGRIDLALDLSGRFAIGAAQLAAGDVAARHEGLRTTFHEADGRWSTRVHPHMPPEFRFDDVVSSCDPSDAQDDSAAAPLEDLPFDLSAGPLWRIAVDRLAEERHRLHLSLHHVVADGWSVDHIARDWAEAYAARAAGHASEWRAPAPRPRDFARFLDDLAAAGIPPPLSVASDAEGAASSRLPPDREATATRSDIGAVVTRTVSATLFAELGNAAGAAEATPASLHFAAAALAISRFTGETELAFGIAEAGRDHPAAHGLVAPLTTIGETRLTLDFDESAGALATRLRAGASGSKDRVARGPLGFVLIFQNANVRQNHFAGLFTRLLPPRAPGILHEITIVFQPLATGCRLTIEYDPGLFSEGLVGQFADHLVSILVDMAADPGRPLSELAMPDIESSFLGEADAPANASPESPAAAFMRIARDSPTRIALSGEYTDTSYGDLATAAQRLAATIHRRLAATPEPAERPLAILTRDGAHAVRAMLAAHLMGHPFLVLDPADDPVRLSAMAATALPAALVHDRGLPPAHLAAAHRTASRQIAFDDTEAGEEGGEEESDETARPDVLGPDLLVEDEPRAYIAFTSGSTGRPKGVVQSKRAFAQFLAWQAKAFGFTPASRVAMWSSPTFDACYTEVFGALSIGATLCIPNPATRRDPAATMRWLAEAGVDYFLTIPSFLALMLSDMPSPASRLKHVAVSGEVLTPALCKAVRAAFPATQLTNLYGPTEAILASWHRVGPSDTDRIPVGRPIAGRRLLLIDPAGRPVPPGAVGEIAILSRHLTMGYLDDTDAGLTPFPPFPYGEAGERLYRTGDLGRISADGALHFLGRRDAEVKVRGHRLSLSDIETVLAAEPGIRAAAATAFPGPDGETRIAAFLILDAGKEGAGPAAPSGGAADVPADMARRLRDAARAALGTASVPARLFTLAALPLTPTGKIDRRALRCLAEASAPDAPPPSAFAGDAVTSAIAGLWRDVLGTHHDADINFFDAGGTSLSAVRLHREIDALFPGRIALRDVFDRPTIRAMSRLLLDEAGDGSPDAARDRAADRLRRLTERPRSTSRERTA